MKICPHCFRSGPELHSTVIKNFDDLIRHISSYRSELPGKDMIQMNIAMTAETADAIVRYFCNNYIFYPQIDDGLIKTQGLRPSDITFTPLNERQL